MFKHHRLLIISLLLILGLALLIVYLNRPQPIEVVVHTVESGNVLSTVANTRAGTLKACQRARLSPSVGGQIESLPIREGDRVKAGQLLLEIWNDNLEAQLKLAKHEYQAAVSRARESCVVAEVAKREAVRLRTLRKQNLTSEESVDRAEGEAKARMAACDAVNTSTKVSQARIDVAEAALDQTRLRAPFDGQVAEVNGELGEFLTPSPIGIPTLPAVDLIEHTCVYVSAPIDEVDAPQIRPNMQALISLDAFGKKTFEGRVRRIAGYVLDVEQQARTVEIEVEFVNKIDTENMLPGYSADAEVILERRENVLRIPTQALLEGNTVIVFTDDGVLQQRQIETGLSNWNFTEVRSGLAAGERIVTSVEKEGVEDGVPAIIENTK